MMPLAADSALLSDSPARRLRNELHAAIGGPCSIWRSGPAGWLCTREGDDAPVPSLPEGAGSAWLAWLDDLLANRPVQPRVYAAADGQAYVAAILEDDGGEPEVLVGRVQLNWEQLVARTAGLALRHGEAVGQQQLIDDYAARLSDCFEELTFLRRLSRHIEYCVADRSLGDTAATILPQLRVLLGVEGVCLIGPGDHPTDGAATWRTAGTSGTLPAPDDYWPALIEQLGPRNRRTLVKNFQGQLTQGTAAPLAELRSFALTPIEKDGIAYGWLLAVNKQVPETPRPTPANSLGHDEIGSMEASLLEAAALMLGSHAANNRLFEEKERLVVDVIHTLVGVIEARDAYTCGHSDRVALMAQRLGAELGLAPDDCHDIYLAGLLHDIGKIGVADDVLLKPGKLTEAEFAEIKRHPALGAQMLQGLKPLERLIPGVLSHHEAFDGSGYPHGLAGEAIPLMARVLAVADAFDAMTSSRPYRAGMPREKAEAILRNGAGQQWDARVVAAYFSARDAIAAVGDHWHDHLGELLRFRGPAALASAGTNPSVLPAGASL